MARPGGTLDDSCGNRPFHDVNSHGRSPDFEPEYDLYVVRGRMA